MRDQAVGTYDRPVGMYDFQLGYKINIHHK